MSMRTAKGSTAAPTYSFNDDTDTGLHSSAADVVNVVAGGAEIGEWSSSLLPVSVVKIAFTEDDGSGVISSTVNPFGYDVLVKDLTVRITTASTGASTLDIGVHTSATTSNDGLIDGLSGATAGLFTNAEDAGTNGEQTIVWASASFLNMAEASGDVTGLVGTMYVTVCKL